ncbi:hypothetical protein I4U23_027190 [Adineta vaga]|nr:hypothetical protein I4U23_027190 [Adineta vaga]
MDTFATKFLDGHVIVQMNDLDYIVDTGSPVSFGRGTFVVINGKRFSLNETAMGGITATSISALSGLKVDGLIGMDILMHFDILFNLNQITFSDTLLAYADTTIKLPIIDTVMSIPIITLNIGHKDRRIFFDSGAKLSYLSEDLLVSEPIGQMEDFYFTIGTYTTNIYKIDVTIGEKIESLTFGLLPAALRMMLDISQTKGVIGTELLKKYSIILSNLNKYLALEPYDEGELHNSSGDKLRLVQKNLTLSRQLSLD